jgi:hypothetical protein
MLFYDGLRNQLLSSSNTIPSFVEALALFMSKNVFENGRLQSLHIVRKIRKTRNSLDQAIVTCELMKISTVNETYREALPACAL